MKKENLIGYMANPGSLDQSSLPELEELLESYPYFQTAHMLLARNHHNMDSVKFHDILRSTAAFAGDRKVLYHLVHAEQTRADAARNDESGLSGKLADILQRESEVTELELTPAYSVEEVPDPPHSQIDEYTFTGWFDHITESADAVDRDTAHESPDGQQDLIDKFLDESPVIRPDTEKEADKSDRSEVSARDNDTLMTETLAKIYVQQGKYRKAIYAYEKLSLKFPEKSTYFASQINRIKSNLEENR